jgi:biopolymer transport protein ExbD
MADKHRLFDVWIVESNTVYREVPYTVVTDWVQQGRLLDEDRLRPTGTPNWIRLGDMSEFAAFLPKIEPHRAEDHAEALEPVQVDFAWRSRTEEEDDDVDMIPLIDISLVLLIFFMMTAAVGGAGTLIPTPKAAYKHLYIDPDIVWIGIQPSADKQTQEYLLGDGDQAKPSGPMSRAEVVRQLDELLRAKQGSPIKLNIRAHHQTPYEVIRDLTIEVQGHQFDGRIRGVYAEVSEKEQP